MHCGRSQLDHVSPSVDSMQGLSPVSMHQTRGPKSMQGHRGDPRLHLRWNRRRRHMQEGSQVWQRRRASGQPLRDLGACAGLDSASTLRTKESRPRALLPALEARRPQPARRAPRVRRGVWQCRPSRQRAHSVRVQLQQRADHALRRRGLQRERGQARWQRWLGPRGRDELRVRAAQHTKVAALAAPRQHHLRRLGLWSALG